MTRILAFSGRKQSGKTTCSNFVHGYQLRAFRVIDNFAITEGGELLIADTEEEGELLSSDSEPEGELLLTIQEVV